jgi:hypothetical protein
MLSLDSAEVAIGDSVQLIAVATDAQGEPVPGIVFVWTSSNSSVATVSSTGLARAVGEGQADIEVDVASAAPLSASISRAPLALAGFQSGRGRSRFKMVVVPQKQQSACDGALGVATWDGIFELSYQASGSHLEDKFTVNQGSSAKAQLARSPGGNSEKADWFGEVKGTGRINNISTSPDNRAPGGEYKLTEHDGGPLLNVGATAVHLAIAAYGGGNCTFSLTYVERMTWTQTRTYIGSTSATGSFGAATVSGTLGKKPAGGWTIGSNVTLVAQLELIDPELPSLPGSAFYIPASAVGVLLVESSPKTAGSATLSYALTAK